MSTNSAVPGSRILTFCLLVAAVGLAGACGTDEEAGGAAGEAAESGRAGRAGDEPAGPAGSAAPQDSAAALRGVLPGLFGIMIGLQEDMRRLDRGLWLESYDTMAVGARAVADHPTVPPEEFQLISGVLGDEMSGFREMDLNVHDLAVEIEGHAQAGRLDAVLTTAAELRRGCLACHTAYRQRLREGLAGDGSP